MPGKFSAISDGINFLGTLSLQKLWNYSLLRASYFISLMRGKSLHSGMPHSVSVEPTTSCNLHCPECPSGLRKFSRPSGTMSKSDFIKVIDQLKKNLMYLILYFQGEPFLNPDFFEIIRYARKNRVYTATSTNGHFLDNDHAKMTVESGLDRLIISLDGIDQETYEQYRKGGELDKVLAGIRNIVKWKKQLKSSRPYVIIQFLVFKANELQIPAMKKLVKELGADKLELKTAQVYDYENDRELIPENPKYARYVRDKNGKWKIRRPMRNRCFRMWSGAVITWDGRVVPCCFDKDAAHQLGKLETHFFQKIWRSKAYRDFRKQVFTGRSKIDICRNCTE